LILLQKIAGFAAKTEFGKNAVLSEASLDEFKKKPDAKIISGISLIIFSYIIGWPAVSVLGITAVYFSEPLIAIIGCPMIYGFSHLVFLLGMYLAGAKYSKIFLQWMTRLFIKKFQSNKKSSY